MVLSKTRHRGKWMLKGFILASTAEVDYFYNWQMAPGAKTATTQAAKKTSNRRASFNCLPPAHQWACPVYLTAPSRPNRQQLHLRHPMNDRNQNRANPAAAS